MGGGEGDIKRPVISFFLILLTQKIPFSQIQRKKNQKEFKNYSLKGGGTGEIYTPLLPNI